MESASRESRRTLFFNYIHVMNKRFSLITILGICLIVTSCSNKPKTREERVKEFRNELTTQDTTVMLKLCDNAMELLKGKQIDQVLASLYEYNDSTKEVKPLTKQTAEKYRRRFKMFPVLDYRRKYYSFQLEECNDVKYEVVFATAEQAGTPEPAKTGYMFNPVKVDGDWKLCVKTLSDEIDMSNR